MDQLTRAELFAVKAAHALRAANIDPDVLAHHLEVAARCYQESAEEVALPRVAASFARQAEQAQAWADLLRS